jgi:hypothetical protein
MNHCIQLPPLLNHNNNNNKNLAVLLSYFPKRHLPKVTKMFVLLSSPQKGIRGQITFRTTSLIKNESSSFLGLLRIFNTRA